MDHKLAVVIVPKGTRDPVGVSRELLGRFQRPRHGAAPDNSEPKFRYKRVGGWFDGLIVGEVGQERWSTVLRMLLDGTPTNAKSPFPGFGPETGAQIESRIEADNTIDLDDVWPLAPCSIIVTPDGEWIAHAAPDHFDDASCVDEPCESWARTRRGLLWEHRGAIAVAWDLSWHFIGVPATNAWKPRTRIWGSTSKGRESWAGRIASTRLAKSRIGETGMETGKKETSDDGYALDRWTAEGGAVSGVTALRLQRTSQ